MPIHKACLITFLALFFTACSTTPGDAARRGGHSEQAANMYRQGADQGDALAALKLGQLIESGQTSSIQYGEAGVWFIRACELGNLVGCHNAGVGYEYGAEGKLGLAKDFSKAAEFYRRAAERGYMQSQYNLGSLYANGHLQNDVEGLKWFLLAQKAARACIPEPLCKWVLQDPPGHSARLRQRMSQASQVSAERQTAEWVVKK